MKQVKKVMLTLLSILLATSVFANKSNWEKLGEVNADVSMDRVTINCSNKGTFKAIKVKVQGATVEFDRVLVKYTTGALDDLRFAQTLNSGQESGPLDLRGNRRTIKEVILYIKAEPKGNDKGKGKGHGKGQKSKRATVQIWGQD